MKYLIFCFIVIAAVAIYVPYSPQSDQYIAMLTYNANTERFYGEVHLWCKIIYYSIPVVTTLFILIPLFRLITSSSTIDPKNTRRISIIILLSLAIGPGLLVNTVFKDNWGRPRPYQVLRGGKTFFPVWKYNWGNKKDNSFPCGHASMGFFLGVPLLARNKRRNGLILSFAGGALVGTVRILQGGHFLSDVIFCAIIVWFSAELVNYIVNRTMKG